MLAAPTTAELAVFTGRPSSSFTDFADQALAQATLMFQIVTKLTELPDDPDLLQLAKNAILEMADRLLLEQPYQAVKAKPFQTETIGSYSYSRVTQTATKVQNGLKTGLFWWDIAVDELSLPGSSTFGHGSIKVDLDGVGQAQDGTYFFVDPADGDEGQPPYIRIS